MEDHVEIGHLTKYDAFRVNRDQVMDPEIRPFSIVLAFFSAFFGKTSIFFCFFLKKNC